MFNSIMNLLNTNNGMFKSEKQKGFMHFNSENGMIVEHGSCHNKSWTDFFEIDDIGITNWDRRTNSGNTINKWNRDGTAAEQVKNAKSVARHDAKVDAHNKQAVLAEELYNELCLEAFGYHVDVNACEALWSAISTADNAPMTNYVDISNLANNMESFEAYSECKMIYLPEIKKMYNDFSMMRMQIRIAVQTKYPSKFPYNFM